MPLELPDDLKAEQLAVEARIRAAFKGVTREGGVSWSQADELDGGGDCVPGAMAEALARDTDRSWDALVDDSDWIHDMYVGGFCFLDPIGTRYYLAPALIRETRQPTGRLQFTLTIDDEHQKEKVSLLTLEQGAAVAHFIRFTIAVESLGVEEIRAALGDEPEQAWLVAEWQKTYDGYWKRFESRGTGWR